MRTRCVMRNEFLTFFDGTLPMIVGPYGPWAKAIVTPSDPQVLCLLRVYFLWVISFFLAQMFYTKNFIISNNNRYVTMDMSSMNKSTMNICYKTFYIHTTNKSRLTINICNNGNNKPVYFNNKRRMGQVLSDNEIYLCTSFAEKVPG